MVIIDDKINDGKQSTFSVSHFNQYGGAPVQYVVHQPMQRDHSYSGSHWMLPSGDYSLCIAPAAARATINKIDDTK